MVARRERYGHRAANAMTFCDSNFKQRRERFQFSSSPGLTRRSILFAAMGLDIRGLPDRPSQLHRDPAVSLGSEMNMVGL
jgi:hypothetical protein